MIETINITGTVKDQNYRMLEGYPSVLQTHRNYETTTEKYTYIDMVRIIDILSEYGWKINDVVETKPRDLKRIGYQMHMIRLEHPDYVVQGNHRRDFQKLEMLIRAAHDGSSSVWFMAAILNALCANGLVSADETFGEFSIRHVGYTDEVLKQAIEHMMNSIPKMVGLIRTWRQIFLTEDEQIAYAKAAAVARWGEEKVLENRFNIPALAAPVRMEDEPTLWTTFNNVQERLVQGSRIVNEPRKTRFSWKRGTLKKAKGIKGIDENIRINRALWTLTDELAKIKTGSRALVPVA